MLMTMINIHKAKTHLSRLVEDVAAGKEVIIARDGRPAARLVPIEVKKASRKPGYLRGKIRVASDFDAALSVSVLKSFEGQR